MRSVRSPSNGNLSLLRERRCPDDVRRAARAAALQTRECDDRALRDLIVVVNGRASGAAGPERLLAEVEHDLRAAGAAVEGRITRDEHELRGALEEADGRRVVLVGGDGSLHAALNLPIDLPELALVPAGRANNVARALGIPVERAPAARIAAAAPARPIDTLLVDDGHRRTRLLEGLSAGLQADARARYHGENSADLGAGAHALASALRGYRPYPVELEVDGEPMFAGSAGQVFLSNMPFFGFGFKVDPLAEPGDGLLEAIVLEARSRALAIGLLLSVYRGNHLERPGVHVRRGRRAVLRGPLPMAADGEPLGVRSAALTMEPGRLRIAAAGPVSG